MGFANALKFIMRQDPDVIMLGEIRDCETATTAIQAALTGHLVISTLHTNDAVGAVARLADLGVDHFKIAGSLLGSVAQRLLRCVCDNCKVHVDASEKLLDALDPEHRVDRATKFYRGAGCKRCLGTGFAGRIPIFEIMPVTPGDHRRHRVRRATFSAGIHGAGRRHGAAASSWIGSRRGGKNFHRGGLLQDERRPTQCRFHAHGWGPTRFRHTNHDAHGLSMSTATTSHSNSPVGARESTGIGWLAREAQLD